MMNIHCQPKRGTTAAPTMPDTEQPDREDDLIGQEAAAAPLGAQDLADIGRGDRDLAAEADAFDEAADEQLVVARA